MTINSHISISRYNFKRYITELVNYANEKGYYNIEMLIEDEALKMKGFIDKVVKDALKGEQGE